MYSPPRGLSTAPGVVVGVERQGTFAQAPDGCKRHSAPRPASGSDTGNAQVTRQTRGRQKSAAESIHGKLAARDAEAPQLLRGATINPPSGRQIVRFTRSQIPDPRSQITRFHASHPPGRPQPQSRRHRAARHAAGEPAERAPADGRLLPRRRRANGRPSSKPTAFTSPRSSAGRAFTRGSGGRWQPPRARTVPPSSTRTSTRRSSTARWPRLFRPGLRVVFTEHGRLSDAGPSSEAPAREPRPAPARHQRLHRVERRARAPGRGRASAANEVGVIYNGIDVDPAARLGRAGRRSARPRRLRCRHRRRHDRAARSGEGLRDAARRRSPGSPPPHFRSRSSSSATATSGRASRRSRRSLGIADRVRFLGHRDDARRWLAGCDVYANSSISEGVSLTILEAMAAGLPVVATAVGGTPEVVTEDCGVLVPSRHPEALADAIYELGESAGRRRSWAPPAARASRRTSRWTGWWSRTDGCTKKRPTLVGTGGLQPAPSEFSSTAFDGDAHARRLPRGRCRGAAASPVREPASAEPHTP